MVRKTLWTALAVLISGPALADSICRFEAERTGGEPAQGITRVVVAAQAGELRVLGSHGATRIEASGRACASSQRLLDQVRIRIRRAGSSLHVEAATPHETSLDVSITLPDSIAVEVQDGSGEATFEDLGSLKLDDGSGNVRIRRIAGAVDVIDGSGNISVDQVGSISVIDGSGEVSVERVTSKVEITSDGSGDVYIRDVTGSVHVVQDGSGEIDIGHVQGNATIDHDGSGHIRANQIGGDFTVLADSSGGISHRNVQGKIAIPGLMSAWHGSR